MNDPRPSPARRALLAALGGLAGFGAALVLAPAPTTRLFSWIAYGSADRLHTLAPDALAYVQLVHAILGAITLGWALTLLGVATACWRGDPRLAWMLIAVPTGAWFLVDSAYSFASGFWRNAVFNAVVASSLAIPLAVLRRSATRGRESGVRDADAVGRHG